jgi:HEAT repeat protein
MGTWPKARIMRRLLFASLPVLLLCLGACRGPGAQAQGDPKAAGGPQGKGGSPTKAGGKDRPFPEPSPQLRQDLDMLMARLATGTPEQRMDVAGRLARFGEYAVPRLMEGLSSPEVPVRVTCAYVLGMLADPRSYDALHRATFDPSQDVRYEAATALLRGGDDRGLAVLVRGLEDADPRVRAKAILVLHGRTGEDFGYRPDASPEDRRAAVARWREWMSRRRNARA